MKRTLSILLCLTLLLGVSGFPAASADSLNVDSYYELPESVTVDGVTITADGQITVSDEKLLSVLHDINSTADWTSLTIDNAKLNVGGDINADGNRVIRGINGAEITIAGDVSAQAPGYGTVISIVDGTSIEIGGSVTGENEDAFGVGCCSDCGRVVIIGDATLTTAGVTLHSGAMGAEETPYTVSIGGDATLTSTDASVTDETCYGVKIDGSATLNAGGDYLLYATNDLCLGAVTGENSGTWGAGLYAEHDVVLDGDADITCTAAGIVAGNSLELRSGLCRVATGIGNHAISVGSAVNWPEGYAVILPVKGRVGEEGGAMTVLGSDDMVACETLIGPAVTVAFDTKGGSALEAQIILKGTTATRPEDSVREGFILTSWRLDGADFDFETPLYANTTLTAYWEPTSFGTPDFTLPGGTTTVGDNAFEGIDASAVYVPDGCASIGAEAFKDCDKLNRIRVPGSCALGENVFDGCEQVFIFSAEGSPAQSYCAAHENCVFMTE